MDILGAAFGLIILSPLLLLVAVLIRLTMGKHVIFKQIRPGLNEKPFTIYKFRTMNDKRTPDGSLLPDGERLTKLGAFLRKSSIDEIPELWNVLKGEMSLVGPRPLLAEYLPYYTKRERLRSSVKPGITGLAQVSGRNMVDWDERLELDSVYVDRISLTLDMRIIFNTFVVVFGQRGVAVNSYSVETSLHDVRASKIPDLSLPKSNLHNPRYPANCKSEVL